jgi:hypothetical protein
MRSHGFLGGLLDAWAVGLITSADRSQYLRRRGRYRRLRQGHSHHHNSQGHRSSRGHHSSRAHSRNYPLIHAEMRAGSPKRTLGFNYVANPPNRSMDQYAAMISNRAASLHSPATRIIQIPLSSGDR